MTFIPIETLEDGIVAKLKTSTPVITDTTRIMALVSPLSSWPERGVFPSVLVETNRMAFREMGAGINRNPDAVVDVSVYCISYHRRHIVNRKGGGSASPTLNDATFAGAFDIADLVYSKLQRASITLQGAQAVQLEIVDIVGGELIPGICMATVRLSATYQAEY